MKTNLIEKMDVIDTAAGELGGIADQLNCFAAALTSRTGAPTSEALERAMRAMAAHISRVSAEITDAAAEIIHENSRAAAGCSRQEGQEMKDSIPDRLQEAYRANEQDAAALVKHFETTGDAENLKKAQEDLAKWEERRQRCK